MSDDKHWMSTAVKHPGYLHEVTHTPPDKKISQAKIKAAEHSDNPHERKAAHLAETFAHFRP